MTWCIPHLSAFATSLSISPSLYLFCSVHKCKRAFSRLMRVPRKKWTVPQLTGAYGMVRVPRKKWTVPQLTGAYGMVRVPRNLDSFFYDCLVLVEFLWFVVRCLWILSVRLFERWLWSLWTHRRSKLTKSSTKWQSPWRVFSWTEQSFCPCQLI